MTHAATQAEVEQALKRAELMIGDPRIDIRRMAERINKLVEALESIVSSHVEAENHYGGVTQPESAEVRIASQALADYRGTKE